MTNKQMVLEVLVNHNCLTTRSISSFIFLKHDISLTPAQVSGALRNYMRRGLAANSPDGSGHMRYWLTDEGKQEAIKELNTE